MIQPQPAPTTPSDRFPSQARVVVIGGGVVGASILFHLAKFGWKDCVLLERSELTSGSSWHAAGQIHTISSDPNISRLQGYTINLYKEIEATSGHPIGLHTTGGFYLASNRTWYDYLKRERSKARYMGLDQEFISVSELARRHPLINPKHYLAALWDPIDGDVDPSGVVYAYAKAARVHGARYFTHTPVTATLQRADGGWDVETPPGTIHAEIVVNATGLWAREAGRMAGLHLPVQPMEHHYLITEDIPQIVERMGAGERLPAGIDYEANIYFRQERNGMLLGTYEPHASPWKVAGTPMDFGHELLQPQLERIADRLELAFERIPALAEAGIRTVVNGPFTFGPDGNPMIGPVPGMTNYWAAVGVMAGFCQAGGVGLCLAEWMIDGSPSIDVWAMDIARFGNFATPDWGTIKSSENYERRFVMTFPNETLPKGRRQKTTALYDRFVARGAVMGTSFGLEHALWFANGRDDAHETPTFGRNRSHDYVAAEVRAVRESVGMLEIANFGKHSIRGPGAKEFIGKMLAGHLPGPGRVALSPMLTPKGKLYGDLTISCLGDGDYLLLGSGAAQDMHRRWFEKHLPPTGVDYRNMSDALHGFAISGPNSRELLQRITRDDVSAAKLRFRDVRRSFVGGVPVILVRLSFSGELGYEIYCEPQFQLALFEALEAAGGDLGLKLYGARALMSLRLEKHWGVWTLDYRPDYTAAEAGLDAFIDWRRDFIGRESALLERERGPARQLVVLVLDTENFDVAGDEAILRDGRCLGHITSGGYAHHLGCSMAMGYVPPTVSAPDTALQVELDGQFIPARVVGLPAYDPQGLRMRG
ncbi:MAG: FAD-dependent oxidoreductase [Gammaproteobacteria bacterium]|nr:FAD-dependent oxidoreductase [Gammaproteobacteria bacterium]